MSVNSSDEEDQLSCASLAVELADMAIIPYVGLLELSQYNLK